MPELVDLSLNLKFPAAVVEDVLPTRSSASSGNVDLSDNQTRQQPLSAGEGDHAVDQSHNSFPAATMTHDTVCSPVDNKTEPLKGKDIKGGWT